MREKNQKQTREPGTEETLYRVGLVAALVAATGLLVYKLGPQELRDFLHRYSFCVIYRFTGFYCPGCGGTRAIEELLRGNLIASFLYHPLAAYGILLYLAFMLSHTAARLAASIERRRKRKGGAVPLEDGAVRFHGLKWRTWYVTAAVVLLIANFAVKNILHLATGADVLAQLDQRF